MGLIERQQFGGNIVNVFGVFAVVAIGLLSVGRWAVAQNVAFMPGDAFFYFHLSEDFVKSLPKDGGKIEVASAAGMVGFGGYAGFERLRLEDVSPQLVQHLRAVYREHRSYTPKIVAIQLNRDGSREEKEEMNPLNAFVYNRDVDWSVQRIALKYNEDWPHLPAEAFLGPDRDMSLTGGHEYVPAEVYLSYVPTYAAVVEDWRNARRFKPLKVRVPKNIAWGKAGPQIIEPVVAKGGDIQIVVTWNDKFEKYFRCEPDLGFYQVTSDEVNQLTWRKVKEGEESQNDEGVVLEKKALGNQTPQPNEKSKRRLSNLLPKFELDEEDISEFQREGERKAKSE